MDKEIKSAALYVRVSTVYQVEKDSLPMQREDLTNYAKLVLGINKLEIFEDAGFSAKNTDRPAFQQMMARMRHKEFTHLLVWKLDRISRNLLDFAQMYNELKHLGVTFVSKNEQFDTSTAMGEAMLKIILVFAELERKMTSERVSSVMIARAQKGLWNGGKVPFGYNYNKATKEFSINPAEAEVVERIYQMYETVPSLIAVARELNTENIFQRSGSPWTPTTISAILHNIFYIGDYRYNRLCESTGSNKTPSERKPEDWIICENHHIPIISRERQQKVLEKLHAQCKSNKDGAKTYARKNVHIFGGLIWCGICGSQYQSTSGPMRNNGFKPSVYMCAKRRRFTTCDNASATDASIGPMILNYIANVIKAKESFGKTTSVEMLEKKLLKGEALAAITGIEQQGLVELHNLLMRKFEDVSFDSKTVNTTFDKPQASELDVLLTEKRKHERALQRLNQLYLYAEDDEAMSNREYVTKKETITSALSTVNKRIAEIEKSNLSPSISDDEFIKKASLFVLANKLQDRRYINFNNFLQSTDKQVTKEFVQSVISKIVVFDSKVVAIRFKNGIEHKFLYN